MIQPIDKKKNSLDLLDVKIYYQERWKSIEFKLDTGASRTCITWEEAKALKINPDTIENRVKASTASGDTDIKLVTVQKLLVIGTEGKRIIIDNIKIGILPKERTSSKSLLGLDILKRCNTFIRFEKDELEISQYVS